MKQVIVNGQSYLANDLANGEGGLVVEKALTIGAKVTQADVQNYMKAANLDTLKDITFGGAGVSYSVVELDEDINFAIEVAGLVMARAEKVAVKNLINQEFDAGLGKL